MFCGNNNCLWLLIILILIFAVGNGGCNNGCGCNGSIGLSNGCGCNNGCGC